MKEIDIVIDNPTGLHARPAKVFVKLAKTFESDISVEKDGRRVNAKSMVSMLTLGVKCGTEIKISAEGADEQAAIDALREAIESGLGEEEHRPAEKKKEEVRTEEPLPENVIKGLAAAPGCVAGPVWHMTRQEIDIDRVSEGADAEKARLRQALEEAGKGLSELKKQMENRSGGEAEIFAAHIELLEDAEIINEVTDKIEKGASAADAWQTTVKAHAEALSALDDPLLAARGADMNDVGYRVLSAMTGADTGHEMPENPVIIIARDLSPSETAALDKERVLGFCTAAGGPTAHSAIIARSMGIPAVVSAGEGVMEIREGAVVVLDGTAGTLMKDPSEKDLAEAAEKAEKFLAQRDENRKSAMNAAVTRDGAEIEVAANIGGLKDALKVVESGADGVGLFRTEFLFLGQQEAPSEDEQFEVYRDIVKAMEGHPIIIRTLDIGGDKPLPYIHVEPEENPFLGERGIRLCLNRPELLRQQLRAIYRASAFGPVRIMFPMVSDVSDWHRIKKETDAVSAGFPGSRVELGVMIEVPSAALTAEALAEHVDFFSIGTNDLTQYTLAIDRMHSVLSGRLDGLHPAVLRLVSMTVKAAEKHGRWVGVCGELAGDLQAVPVFLGLGVKELSMSVPSVADVKAKIRTLDMEECRGLAEKALKCALPEEVRKLSTI